MRVFCQWAQKRDHPKLIEVLVPDTLDSILQDFFAEINKKDGKDYEPCEVTATGLEPRTTWFLNEHSTIWLNWPSLAAVQSSVDT